MEEDLISKKELLELADISYGQLYRWKRKNLIPEEWFIRKSTFTGQETFFPKDKILSRIDKIKNMKDDLSLDELADMFSPNFAEASITKDELVERNIVSQIALRFYFENIVDTKVLTFNQVLFVFMLDKFLRTGEMSLEEGKILLQVLHDHYEKFQGKNCEIILLRKMGISLFLLLSSPSDIFFENSAKVVLRFSAAEIIEELKIKFTG